ncbi:hypothetical protein SAMN04244573_01132 [Azotobacter beijerinckii]|uniref:Uncharacterized protein n=1 Tax=Azotobacter beijerinckii TaxID=170623 RepID=A0A1H9DV66_9GAMM|nr:hypothetical protein SAMN04244573_01132 [Azotobacter beijerinckii]
MAMERREAAVKSLPDRPWKTRYSGLNKRPDLLRAFAFGLLPNPESGQKSAQASSAIRRRAPSNGRYPPQSGHRFR